MWGVSNNSNNSQRGSRGERVDRKVTICERRSLKAKKNVGGGKKEEEMERGHLLRKRKIMLLNGTAD